MSSSSPVDLSNVGEIMELVSSGNKIEAIKQARETFGLSLKDAKVMVDKMANGEPVELSSTQFVTTSSSYQIDQSALEAEIRADLEANQKIEAIKRYRMAYQGVGLKDAKEAVEIFQATGKLPAPDLAAAGKGMGVAVIAAQTMERITQLANAGQKSEAASLFRETFDVSQQVAEEAVDALAEGEAFSLPTLKMRVQSNQPIQINTKGAAAAAGGLGCMGIILALVILAAVLIPIGFAMIQPGMPLASAWSKVNPLSIAHEVLSFGQEGIGPGYLTDPRYIAVEPAGNMVIAGYDDSRVQRFNSVGEYLNWWNTEPETYTTGLATSGGRVFVAYNGTIKMYDSSSGEFLGEIAPEGDYYFEDLATGPDGGIVAVSNNEDVVWLDERGNILREEHELISKVDSDGELDSHIAVDGLGNIYLLGTFRDSVFVYSPQGQFLNRFGSDGDEPGQFRAPDAIAVDNQGHVYVSDIEGIQVFDHTGRYIDHFTTSQGVAFDLAVDGENQLYAVTNQPRVVKYNVKLP
jgi:ribosomal protein L7/L12